MVQNVAGRVWVILVGSFGDLKTPFVNVTVNVSLKQIREG